MCGIAGVIAWDENFRASPDALERMRRCIAHRGPDAHAIHINHEDQPTPERPQAALIHHRLSVIDLDPRSNQPFTDHRGRHIVFNGEIYNYRELRAQLPDYPWRTTSDTEVLLAAYDAWGFNCVDHLNGMFAFAIWDERERTLFLARDPMGQKPLYFTLLGGREGSSKGVAFASELNALRHSPHFDASTDSQALGMYLRWGYIPAPFTIYASAEKLPAGSWMRISPSGAAIEQYFDPNQPHHPTTPPPHHDLAARTRDLVTQAVQRQLLSDVPLGCFLSGGIDSSIIAAAMTRARAGGKDQQVLTFSIGFEDQRYDETRYAAEVAKHLGTKHQQFIVTPNAAEDLPKLAATFGEPFADSSALPTHYLSRETRRHVTVALSGDGGDELFAGYDRYRALWLGASFDQLPDRLKNIALSKLWQRLPFQHAKHPVTRLKRLLKSLELPPPQRYDSYMRIGTDELIDRLLRDRAFKKDDAQTSQWLVREFQSLAKDRDVVETALALDRITYLPGDLLFKVDASSMLHALEVRSPFMDPELVRFAGSLTTQDLLGAPPLGASFIQSPMLTPGKRLLRAAFARDLPPSVFKRKKMGFAVPISDWLRTSLRPMLHDLLTSRDSFAAAHFHRDAIDQLLLAHESEHSDYGPQLYSLLMLELWHRAV